MIDENGLSGIEKISYAAYNDGTILVGPIRRLHHTQGGNS